MKMFKYVYNKLKNYLLILLRLILLIYPDLFYLVNSAIHFQGVIHLKEDDNIIDSFVHEKFKLEIILHIQNDTVVLTEYRLIPFSDLRVKHQSILITDNQLTGQNLSSAYGHIDYQLIDHQIMINSIRISSTRIDPLILLMIGAIIYGSYRLYLEENFVLNRMRLNRQ